VKHLFFLGLLSLLIFGCDSKKQGTEVVSFYNIKGAYISADKYNDSILIADKKEINFWEKFYLQNINGNQYAIKTIDNLYVTVDTSRNNCLIANKKTIQKEGIFEIVFDKTYDIISIKAFNANYVSIGKDKILRAADKKEPLISSIYLDQKQANIFNSYFNNYQLIFLGNALLLLLLSIIVFNFRKKINLSLVFLILGGISLRIFAIMLDPYLNIWDERFHALVAKNMMDNPFKPMLYLNPILAYDHLSWVENHVWLHKQPLFLWQIALFFKVFGVNEFILRLPSLIMSTIMILFTYRIGRLISNKKTAYYAALLFTTSYYILELVVGLRSTDHNDIAFAFYLTASIWAWTEFYHSKNRNWILLIGLFAGLSILNKWLTGLLVYSAWGLLILYNPKDRKSIGKYIELLLALTITIIVALPWQLYILSRYPNESNYEFDYNSRHFFEAIESHSGDYFFHFNETVNIYGLHFLIVIAAVLLLNKIIKKNEYKIAYNTYIILIYLFFTIAATKIASFTYCISVLVYIALGAMLYWLFEVIVVNKNYLANKVYSKLFKIIIVFTICIFNLNLEELQYNHSKYKKNKTNYRTQKMTYIPVFKKLNKILPDNKYVIFNAPKDEAVSIMFYSGICTYEYPITPEIYKDLKNRKIKMASFDYGELPEFVKNDKEIFLIN
jgi:4-amino-4-deoxy-L-arabinose transferase